MDVGMVDSHDQTPARRHSDLRRVVAPSCEIERCQLQVEALVGPLRRAARSCGYALAVHGSMKRDVDLIAVPWVEEALEPEELVENLLVTLRSETGGEAFFRNDDPDPNGEHCWCSRNPQPKPHGRLAWAIRFSAGGPQIDLSVVALRKE